MPPTLSAMLSLLSLVTWTAGHSVPWSRGYPGPTAAWPPTADRWHADDPARAQQLELIDHVLRNGRQWGRVLGQGVKLTARNRPPYHGGDDADAAAALPRLVDAGATLVTPLTVLQRATRLPWLGSYVEYALYVTRAAFECLTVGNARLVTSQLKFMWSQATSAARAASQAAPFKFRFAVDSAAVNRFGVPARAFDDLRALLALMASKVAAVHGDPAAVVDALFGPVFAGHADPEMQYHELVEAHIRFNRYVEQRCAAISEQDALLNAGAKKSRSSTPQEHLNFFDQLVASAMDTYDAFGVEVASLAAWSSVVYYEDPVVKSKPYLQPSLR